jgi:hypothetical protein
MTKNAEDAGTNPKPLNQVGYGSPPESTRFKKGVSGNPKGRPKGSVNVATSFAKALREKVVINERGQRKTVTKLEAALKQLVNKAASGDLRALRQLIELARDAEAKQSLSGEKQPVLTDLDQEVIEGILKRFSTTSEEDQDNQEVSDASNKRG